MADEHRPQIEPPAIMVSYRKLLDIEKTVLAIESGFKVMVALQATVDDHELRLVALEQIQAIGLAKKSVWNSIRTFIYGAGSTLLAILLAVIAGGYLPKLWGG